MTTPKLERMYDERRTRLQAAYEICPELREVAEALEAVCKQGPKKAPPKLASYTYQHRWFIYQKASEILAKLDKIK